MSIVLLKPLKEQLALLLEQEGILDNRAEFVVFPYLSDGTYHAGDIHDMSDMFQAGPGVKTFVPSKERCVEVKGVMFAVRYVIKYIPVKGKQHLKWGDGQLSPDDLEYIDHTGFAGSIPPALTGTHFIEPTRYFALAVVKRQ